MKKIMKRLIAIVCVAVMLVGLMSSINLGQVQATDAGATAGTPEKTVEVQELTEGTVTPNQEEWNGEYTKAGYVFGGYYDDYDVDSKKFSNPITGNARTATTDNPIYIRWVPEEVMNVKAQVRQDELRRVISNCDGKTEDSNIATKIDDYTTKGNVCTTQGLYKEGSASIGYTAGAKALLNLYLLKTVDVSGYQYFSCKLYIADTSTIGTDGNLQIRLYSTYTTGTAYLQFTVKVSELANYKMEGEDKWYEFKLPFSSESYTGDGYNSETINSVQVRQSGTNETTVYIDDIYVYNDPQYDNCETVISNCDGTTKDSDTSDSNITYKDGSNGTWCDEEGYVQEGEASLKRETVTTSTTIFNLSLTEPVNVTGYKYFSCKLYIDDTSKLKADSAGEHLYVVLSSVDRSNSSGALRFYLTVEELAGYAIAGEAGWYELNLPLDEPDYIINESTDTTEAYNSASIKFVQIRSGAKNTSETMTVCIDDIYVYNDPVVLMTDCDSTDGLTSSTGTQKSNLDTENVKQGSGAFKYTWETGAAATIYALKFKNQMDLSRFRTDNYSLHFWFYIDNPLYIKGEHLIVALGNGNTVTSTTGLDYKISKENLVSGWNEIYINLRNGSDDTDGGDAYFNQINRLYIVVEGKFTETCTTRLDDIRLVHGNAETADVRFVSTVESVEYQKVGYEITQSFAPTAPLTTETIDVYQSLYELGTNGVVGEVEASDISGLGWSEFMHAATVVNLPNRLWDAIFTVVPYWVTQDGTTVKGVGKPYTINYLLNASDKTEGELGEIDIYLIAGQSNAAGNTHIDCDLHNHAANVTLAMDVIDDGTLANENPNYVTGFSDVLYSGTSNTNSVKMAWTKANIHNNGFMGPEVGMAEALSSYYAGSNKTVGIVKYGYGGTGMLDTPGDTDSETIGNWVSPSYEAALGSVNHGENTGKLYENLLAQVKESLQYYAQTGYTPVIKGLYWMQGENDRGTVIDGAADGTIDLVEDYKAAFTYFAQDIRADLAKLTGDANLTEMPIVIGTISETFSFADTEKAAKYNTAFIEIQKDLASEANNIYIADNSKYAMNELVGGVSQPVEGCDGKHWNWSDCLEIGNNVGEIFESIYRTDYRVLITSDVHYTTLEAVEKYGVTPADRMQLWVDSIIDEHENQPIDLIIVNGDVSLDFWESGGYYLSNNNTGETKTFIDAYVSQLREIAPVMVMPGNHEQYSEADWQALTGNGRSGTYVLGKNLFIMLDSYRIDVTSTTDGNGAYTTFDVDALKTQLAQYPNHKVYIISHNIDMTKQNAADNGAFKTLLQENDNIIGLFAGHTHVSSVLGSDGTYGGKMLAQTGNFSYFTGSFTEADKTTDNFWGFRDLTITAEGASSRYITADCSAYATALQEKGVALPTGVESYARREINEVIFYSSPVVTTGE